MSTFYGLRTRTPRDDQLLTIAMPCVVSFFMTRSFFPLVVCGILSESTAVCLFLEDVYGAKPNEMGLKCKKKKYLTLYAFESPSLYVGSCFVALSPPRCVSWSRSTGGYILYGQIFPAHPVSNQHNKALAEQ